MQKKIILLLTSMLLILGGCGKQTTPPYFEPIVQELETNWESSRTAVSTYGLTEVFCDRGLSNGGSQENGVFTCFIQGGSMGEGEYFQFDLTDHLPASEEWEWSSAGAFIDEEGDKGYVLFYDFNMLMSAGERDPQLMLVDFSIDNPAEYQATPYSVSPRETFSWHCASYRIGNDLYIEGQDDLAVIDLETKDFHMCSEEHAIAEIYAQNVIEEHYATQEKPYYMLYFKAIEEVDDVVVYAAEISEASDMPGEGIIFVAFKEAEPIAYMHVDLRVEDISQALEITFEE